MVSTLERLGIEILQERELTTSQLERFIIQHSDDERIPLDLQRMNLVGTLRSMGYVIPRRKGFYRITGFEPKEVLPSIEQWPEYQRKMIDLFLNRPKVTIDQLRRYLSTYSDIPGHGFTAGEVLTYQLSRDTGRVMIDGSIGIMKFSNAPRMRIHFPNQDLPITLEHLSAFSLRDVRVVNGDPKRFERRDLSRYQWTHETVYDCDYLVNGGMEGRINSGNRHALRHNLREIKYLSISEFVKLVGADDARDAMYKLIDTWRAGPAGLKQRQLAITRDYRAVDMALVDDIIPNVSFVGTRDMGAHLCCLQVADQLPGRPEYVAQLVEKSLNYPTQEGGYNGTSNANLFLACQKYLEMGITKMNGGSYTGGTEGLIHHKRMMSFPENDVKVQEFTYRGYHFDPLKIST